MIGWLLLAVYELVAVEMKTADVQAGRLTPWWRQPLTDPLWQLQNVHWLLRFATWAVCGWVAWHFTVEPLRK